MNKKQYIQPNVRQVAIFHQSIICFSTTNKPADPALPQMSKEINVISIDEDVDVE